ncbi:MAG: HAD family phosphatase [Limnothrix sp. RL_2_0]|nr:HAD family phosphatase [Limnothrix sp. RL_2_0]
MIDIESVEAIIFNLGGVILNIDYPKTILAFDALHEADISDIYSQDDQADLFDAFEIGALSAWQFRNGLRKILKIRCDDGALDQAWNAMLVDIPLPRIELLEKLRSRKRLFLLSNTNPIHKLAFDKIFKATCGDRYGHLDQLFEQAYYSHHVGDRKPNLSMFQRVIQEQHLEPSRTLVIEDKASHIAGAKKAGLQTYHLTKKETLIDLPWLQLHQTKV